MNYPPVYHKAVNHLVEFGGHGGDCRLGRHLIAQALVSIRHSQGRKAACAERLHMLYISGQFPVKGKPRIKCDQCDACMINGVFCHETGCPNSRKRWENGEWVKYRKCFTCGCDVRADEPCCEEE
jgi:hypothetical protein